MTFFQIKTRYRRIRPYCALCKHIFNDNGFVDNAINNFNVVYGVYFNICQKVLYNIIIIKLIVQNKHYNMYIAIYFKNETRNNLYQRHLLNLSRIRTKTNTDPLTSHFPNITQDCLHKAFPSVKKVHFYSQMNRVS